MKTLTVVIHLGDLRRESSQFDQLKDAFDKVVGTLAVKGLGNAMQFLIHDKAERPIGVATVAEVNHGG